MFRTKKDVDRHVSDILSKIHNENERNLRGYNFARLYFQVKQYDDAKKHLAGYLSVRDHHAPSHKLMAQIHEATQDFEKALQSYKRSLEIDTRQKDVVLKICEMYCRLPVDQETAKYWADRADQLFPHNAIVFKLRECLMSSEGDPDRQELEKLITSELAVQPNNLQMRLKLLRLYLDTERVKEAYEHAVQFEKKKPFPISTDWYYMLVDIFEAYQEEFGQELDFNFYVLFLTALDRLVFLTLAEPHALHHPDEKELPKSAMSVNDAAAALQQFDCHLKKASEKDLKHGAWLYFFGHMKGQLYLHLGCLVIKHARKEQGKWKEANRIASALFLIGYMFKPENVLHEVWFLQMDEQQKLFTGFFHEGALRTSFIGHTIISMCKDEEKSKWLQKIRQDVCLRQVRERTYNRLFSGTNRKVNTAESFFQNDPSFTDTSLEFPSSTSLLEYDKSLYKLCPGSLHQLVWLHLHQKDPNVECFQSSLHEAFKGTPFKNSNLSKGSPESLCLLDIEAYLVAVIYTANLLLEHKTALNSRSNDNTMAVPPFIAEPLCSVEQSSWWSTVHGMVNRALKERFSDHRRILQHGLEVIRGIHNHGLEIKLVVHLARAFADKAVALTQDGEAELPLENENLKSHLDKASGLEYRAVHYWNIAINMLDVLLNNMTLRVPTGRMFVGHSEKLSSEEIVALKEEGQLYLACRLMNSGFLEDAVRILEKLSFPHASYYLALTYKKLAYQEGSLSNARTALLHKSKDALYTTMDRIKGETTHILNEDLYIEVEEVEREIGKQLNYANANSSRDSADGDSCDAPNISFKNNASVGSTPHASQRLYSTPKPSASFMTIKSKSTDEHAHRTHLEPSPERLDAQIRALALTQSTLIKTLVEQQRSLLDTNKAIIEGLKQNTTVVVELKKQLDELQFSTKKPRQKPAPKKTEPAKPREREVIEEEEEEEDDEEEECSDYETNGFGDYYVEDTMDNYRPRPHPQNNYNYPQARVMNAGANTPGVTYVPPAGLAPAAPPPAMPHYGYQYPPPGHHGMAQHPHPPPHGAIPEGSHYYPAPMNHGLPFSEGQPLPQFRFHVASAMMKQPMLSNMHQPNMHVMPPPIAHLPPQTHPSQSWPKQGTVPHAFQIPLPSATIASQMSHPPAAPSHAQYGPPAAFSQMPSSYMNMPNAVPKTPVSDFNMRTLLSNPSPGFRPDATPQGAINHYALANSSLTGTPHVPPSAGVFSTPNSGVKQRTPETLSANRSRQDSDVFSDVDVEREVMGDFTPVIPLPAEVKVQTGEEDEVVLFEGRAKLFRFVDREWKERGTGTVKLLKQDSTGRIRLLMRRDQVHKVCANHRILPSMEILPLKGSDKALTWAAQDFADETVKLEQFCIRFKTGDIADDFKKAFDEAVVHAKLSEEKKPVSDARPVVPLSKQVPSPGFGAIGMPKPGSWTCPTCLVSNQGSKTSCIACETIKPGLKVEESSSNPTKSPFTVSTTQPITTTAATNLCNFSGKPFIYQTPVITLNETTPQKDNFGTVSVKTSTGRTSQPATPAMFGNFSFSSSDIVTQNAPQDVSVQNRSTAGQVPADGTRSGIFGSFSFTASELTSEPIPETGSVFPKPSTVVNTISTTTASVAQAKEEPPKAALGGFVFSAPSEKPQDSLSFSNGGSNSGTKPVSILGGFTFTSPPVVTDNKGDSKDREILVVTTKSKDGPQVSKLEAGKSPFSGFSFKAGSVENQSQSSNSFVFGTAAKFSNTSFSSLAFDSKKDDSPTFKTGAPLFVTVNKEGRNISGEVPPEEFVPTAEFAPAVPLPALVDVKTGEEDEEKVFGERVRLYRYDSETKEWKERGIGELKLLYQKGARKYRILMRREQVLKICANHYILPEMKLSPLATSDRSWVWVAQDFSDGNLTQEKFAAKFKSPSVAQEFYDVFQKCIQQLEGMQKLNAKQAVDQSVVKAETLLNSIPQQNAGESGPCAGNKLLFSDLFKPAPESWECSTCYVRNEKNVIRCQACETLRPSHLPKVEDRSPSKGWECVFCQAQNHEKDISCATCGIMKKLGEDVGVSQSQMSSTETIPTKPLSQIFKPDPLSWECETCYVRNKESHTTCVACETPKPGTTAPTSGSVFGQFDAKSTKPFSSGFVFGTSDNLSKPTFQFGTFPNASNSAGFNIGASDSSNSSAPFGGKMISVGSSALATSGDVLKGLSTTTTPNFVFGKPQSNTSSANQQPVSIFGIPTAPKPDDEQPGSPQSVEFRFGSPQKYEFNFSGVRPRSPSKCPKSPKSPGTPTDVEEDEEEVEQSDVDNIYFQPVIPLPPKVVVKTGEEDETVLFSKRAKLFRFVDGEWKERGIGDVKILHDNAQNKVRLLMRRDQVLKVCMNHYLTKDIAFSWKSNKSLSWAAADFSENEPTAEQFAIRFKTIEFAQQFKDAIDSAIKLVDGSVESKPGRSPTPEQPSGPRASVDSVKKRLEFSETVKGSAEDEEKKQQESYAEKLSNFSFSYDKLKGETGSSPFSLSSRFGTSAAGTKFDTTSNFFSKTVESKADPDINITYEAVPTAEQIKAAEKLMLPRSFYLYENNPPCPGCRGCEDDATDKSKTALAESVSQAAASESEKKAEQEDAPSLFSNTTLSVFSFADLASKSASSGFGALGSTTSPKTAFPGAGAPVFGNMNQSNNDEEDGDVVQGPDIHFEPVIPMPSLVEVKTGEEDEIPLFCQRAKLYRYDGDTRQWKERGVGEIKILQHKEKSRFRILLRRDQVHKVACNHVISPSIELKPMSTSENSLCWSAVDYSDGRPDSSQFAVRFKNKDILQEFRAKFEECKSILSKSGDADVSAGSIEKLEVTAVADSTPPSKSICFPEQREDPHNHSDEEDEDDDGDDELYFEEVVPFEIFDESADKFQLVGEGHLQVMYDDSVYGYRILVTNDTDEVLCDHIIAIQTCLRRENLYAIWAAIDISVNPPKRRQFRATFSTDDALQAFEKVFEDGKQMAMEAEIVEKSNILIAPLGH